MMLKDAMKYDEQNKIRMSCSNIKKRAQIITCIFHARCPQTDSFARQPDSFAQQLVVPVPYFDKI